MKEIVEDNHTLNRGIEECCNIAESMIDEIHQIVIPERVILPTGGRHKGSLKKMLLRQIRQARKMAMMG
jgi:hypothetical protein